MSMVSILPSEFNAAVASFEAQCCKVAGNLILLGIAAVALVIYAGKVPFDYVSRPEALALSFNSN